MKHKVKKIFSGKTIVSHSLLSTVGALKNYRFTYSDNTFFDYSINTTAEERTLFIDATWFINHLNFTLTQPILDNYDRIVFKVSTNITVTVPFSLSGKIAIYNGSSQITYLFNSSYTTIRNAGKIKQTDVDVASSLTIKNNEIDHVGALID